MLICELDHLVVTSPNLATGIACVEQKLHCKMQPGGQHPRMGTHNALLKIGDQCYMEVIAIDPAAKSPQRPRWFELDTLSPDNSPRLAGWVMRTNDIESVIRCADLDPGPIEDMNRGALEWRVTIRDDGGFLCHGVAPSVIQWKGDRHPASTLPDAGVSLIQLEGRHPDAQRIRNWISHVHMTGPLDFHEPEFEGRSGLVALIRTPKGLVRFT